MGRLDGKVVWVTGAGSGIGEAAAQTLAAAGASVVLSGRRRAPLEAVAARIGPAARVAPGDMTVADEVGAIAAGIEREFGRLDILVANAGLNIVARGWDRLSPAGAASVIGANLNSAFYCASAVLPMMRRQKDGVLIHTASLAGRFIGLLSGPAYTAAKHGVVAMSHTINMEECVHGIRSSVINPGEVATPILDQRPVPVSAEERARMVQPGDVADLILYIACLPPHVVLNEVIITPTWNRGYVAALERAGR
ncbi:MAG: SDR family NAD(P)-dependent oxidoreductase [Rhodospirillales bacterium]|nr:SDR family NAD(P)-dependent oxidoreductase [Rhodospirillales bacterium]